MPISNIISIATDGSLSMTSKKQWLIRLLSSDASYPDFLPVHCIVHWAHLVAKYFRYPEVTKIALQFVNFIRSSAKTHRQFKSFIEDMDNDELPYDVSWHCLVRWLSLSNVLGNFFQLRDPIKQFLQEKEKSFSELNDPSGC